MKHSIKSDTNKLCNSIFYLLGIFVLVIVLVLISSNENPSIAYAVDSSDVNIDYISDNPAFLSNASNGTINLGSQPINDGNIHYIDNYKYFLQNPSHHANDGSDNSQGTCTTVAVQMLLGYHAYYSDRRLVPDESKKGRKLVSDGFGSAIRNPQIISDTASGLGDKSIGTLDGVYDELWDYTTWPEFPGLGQNLIALKNAANEFVEEEAPSIKDNVSITYNSFDDNQAKNDLDHSMPIILGMSFISAEADSYHVVVAYGYASINGTEGYIVHFGYDHSEVQMWVPTSWFSFQLRMSVAHLHTFVPILDENGSSIIDNTYKIIKCTECHSVQVDELYDTNRDNNIITGLKYAPIKNVSIPSSYKGIGDGVFKGTDIETLAFSNSDFKIGDSAFENCESLSTISGTSKISHIGKYAFRSCGKLKYFTIGASVSSIGQGAFAGCNNCDINVVGGNEHFCSEGNIVYNKDRTSIVASGKTASVFDFSAIRTIAPSAFEGNNSVTKLTFDQIDIGERAFYDCPSLSEVCFDAFSVQQFGADCFGRDSFIAYVPYYLQGDYAYLFTANDISIVSRKFNVTYFDGETEVVTQMHYYGEPISQLPVLNRTGYTFAGWHKHADLTDGIVSDSDNVKWQEKVDVALYAEWNANTYAISFEGVGCENLGSKNVVFNERIGELPLPTRIGYEFAGWKNGGNEIVSTEDLYLIAGDSVLMSTWRAKTYTITFHACGGTPDIQTVQCAYNEIIATFPNVERDGYFLNEWNAIEDGSGECYNSGFVYTYDGHLDLYAQWDAITYSIIYVLNGGINSASNPAVYTTENDDIILNPATKSGYSFVGWRKDDAFISKIESGSFTALHNNNKSILDVFLPIVKHAVINLKNKNTCDYCDVASLQDEIYSQLGVKISELSLLTFLRRLEKENVIELYKNKQAYKITGNIDYDEYMQNIEGKHRDINMFISSFIKYSDSALILIP